MTAYDGLSEYQPRRGQARADKVSGCKNGASLVLVPLYASHTYEARIQLAIARRYLRPTSNASYLEIFTSNTYVLGAENSVRTCSPLEQKCIPLWKLDYESLLIRETGQSYLSAISCEIMKLMSAPGDEFNRSLMEKLPGSVDGW